MKGFKSIRRATVCIAIAACLLLVAAAPVWAQHDMQNMPGMNMGSSKPKSKPKSKSTAAKRKRTQKRGGTNAMRMKGMNMPSRSRASSRPKTSPAKTMDMNMPGMQGMPEQTQTAKPNASPEQMNMPGMQMPSSTSAPAEKPSPSHQNMDMSMPGMQMPASSPQPSSSTSPKPAASPQMEMNMPGMNMPAQTPSTQPGAKPEQMSMPGMQMPQTPATPGGNQTNPHATHNMGGMSGMDMGGANEKSQPAGGMAGMNMPGMEMGSNGVITTRSGSGTMWQPASTPMHMLHMQKGDWMIMFHGDAKVGVNTQGGPRGVTKFESQNWLMAMASRKVSRGTLDLRSMFSFEPFTLSPGGSPELFQTGETYKGQALRDKQHPHDLFMTLSASYTLKIGERGSWYAYFGFPGEPALGPVAFMHRASAAENPSAPLAHHLQDSTHVSFGVFTTGFTYRWFKVEGSLFNGREPDENRYDFEFNPWNSRSVRVQFAPNRNWAAQVSYGLLKNPEALEPGDVRRTTASVSYNKQLARGNWATTFIWGRNRENHNNEAATLNGYTAESTLQFKDRNYLYTRLELVDKNSFLDSGDRLRLGITEDHPVFRIGAYTFGAARDVWETDKFTVALGGDVTFYSKPAVLDSIYGNNPTSYHFFVRFRLGRMTPDRSMGNMSGMSSTNSPHGNHQP